MLCLAYLCNAEFFFLVDSLYVSHPRNFRDFPACDFLRLQKINIPPKFKKFSLVLHFFTSCFTISFTVCIVRADCVPALGTIAALDKVLSVRLFFLTIFFFNVKTSEQTKIYNLCVVTMQTG